MSSICNLLEPLVFCGRRLFCHFLSFAQDCRKPHIRFWSDLWFLLSVQHRNRANIRLTVHRSFFANIVNVKVFKHNHKLWKRIFIFASRSHSIFYFFNKFYNFPSFLIFSIKKCMPSFVCFAHCNQTRSYQLTQTRSYQLSRSLCARVSLVHFVHLLVHFLLDVIIIEIIMPTRIVLTTGQY